MKIPRCKHFKLLLTVLVVIVTHSAICQVIDPCKRSTEGTDFWFAFMQSRTHSLNHLVEITITSRYACNCVMYIGKADTAFANITLAANEAKKISVDWLLVEAINSEEVQQVAIHLVSDNPINVYALNWDVNSSDVALIYPTEALSNEYYTMCYTPNVVTKTDGSYGSGRNSEFLIVAAKDSTKVTITPSVVTDKLKPANVPFEIILNKGEVYQVQSMNASNLQGQGDLTGSYIKSDSAIAVFSGSLSTTVPYGASAWDHLFEQIPPVRSWGTKFVTVPLKTRERDTYRILASENNTRVKIGVGATPISLSKGQYYEYMREYTEPTYIESNKPILVAQYSNSQSVDAAFTGRNGDPFMIIISPVNQTMSKVTFVAYNSAQIVTYYLNVVTLTRTVGNITIDGSYYNPQFNVLLGTPYSYAQIPLTPGSHQIESNDSERGFIAYVYGFGGLESYGYSAGFNLDLKLTIDNNLHFDQDTLAVCYGDTLKVSANNSFDFYKWNTLDTTSEIAITKGGTYFVTASTIGGCRLSDSIQVVVSKPEVHLGNDTSYCIPDTRIIDAGTGFTSYLWQNNEVTQTLVADSSGIFWVEAVDKYGCKAADTINLDFRNTPKLTLDGDTLVCEALTTELLFTVSNVDPNEWTQPGAIVWSSVPSGLRFDYMGNNKMKVTAPALGKYKISSIVKTQSRCVDTTYITVSFQRKPSSQFIIDEGGNTNPCKSYERIVKFIGVNGSGAIYDWDFGGCMILENISETEFRITAGANNPNRNIQLVVDENGCISDTANQVIGVTPNFRFWAEKGRGCDSMTVQFQSEMLINDSVTYSWNFGDGAVSTLKNPVHFFRDKGLYDVSLMVTNVIDGCRNGYTDEEMIQLYPTPIAGMSASIDSCYSDTLRVAYTFAIDSSISFWSSPDALIMNSNNNDALFDLSTKATSTIALAVSEFGCISDTVQLTVNRKPHFSFSAIDSSGCVPFGTRFLAESNDDLLSYFWNIDTLSNILGSEVEHTFVVPGSYDIQLRAISNETGCTDSLFVDEFIRADPLPNASFVADFPVAVIEQALITFQNNSTGANYYSWYFGDGDSAFAKEAQHKFMQLGKFDVLLIAETDFGCLDSAINQVEIVPFSSYTPNAFRPSSNVPENKVFRPVGIGADPNRFLFQVFNRLGKLVFESRNPAIGWDGLVSGKQEAPVGVYIWTSEYNDIQGLPHKQKGTVMLVR